MSKKKLVIMAATLIVAAATVAGGTLAYFTHSKEIVNTLTAGNVKIELSEPIYDSTKPDLIMPGLVIKKDPTITNTGENDCLVRVKLDAMITDTQGKPSTLPVTASQLVDLLPGWTQGVGEADKDYYYYSTPLAKDASVKVFDEMTVPASWDNRYQGLKLKLNVTAHAIQADNFKPVKDPTGNTIIGWSGVVIEK